MFKLKEKNAKVTTEIVAGLTTFFTMAYIIFVNPNILADGAGAEYKTSIFVATCLASFFGTLLMGLLANIPFAQAPGMGLNAFFAYTVMLGFGYTYAQALAIVFISGLLFILITAIGLRQAIVRAIPKNLKTAISVGIGLFIAFIGLKNDGTNIIVNNDSTLVALNGFKGILEGDAAVYGALMTILGLVIITVLTRFKVPGAILIGIAGTSALYWLIGSLTGIAPLPSTEIDFSTIGTQFGEWADKSFGVAFTEGFTGLFQGKSFLEGLIAVGTIVLSFSFVDMFDTIGTIIGTAGKAGMLDENGDMPEMKKAMFADAIATSVGAAFGTSTVTTFVESSSGIAAGGKTGLSSVITSVCFLLALALSPLTGFVPGAATNAAIIFVGVLMMSSVTTIDWDDITEAVPAFICIIGMPLCYSISDGIFLSIIAHVVIKLLSGKLKDVSIIECILAALFILKYLFV